MAKGMKTGGRVAGTPNKITASIKETAGAYSSEAVQTLVDLMRNENTPPAVRLAAANALLDRAVGKPRQELEHAGSEKEPLQIMIRHFSDNGALEPG